MLIAAVRFLIIDSSLCGVLIGVQGLAPPMLTEALSAVLVFAAIQKPVLAIL